MCLLRMLANVVKVMKLQGDNFQMTCLMICCWKTFGLLF